MLRRVIAWRRRRGRPTPVAYAQVFLAAMITYFAVLRPLVYPLLTTSFPHWNDWTAADAGDVVYGLLIQVGIAVAVVAVLIFMFRLAGRLIVRPCDPPHRRTGRRA